MTIDEAIDFCKEKSKNIKLRAEPQTFVMIADMLEELKAIENGFTDDLLNMGFTKGYNKAIDDAINEIVSVRSEVAEKEPYDVHLFTVLVQRQNEIVDLIQKLKVGGKNE